MPRNSNLMVPPGWSAQDKRFGDGVKENLDVLLGHRGDPLQRAVTFQDLLDSNLVQFKSGSIGFSSSGDLVPIVNNVPNLDVPPAPTSLQASGAFQNIILSWNLSLYRGHSFVELWRHTSNDIAAATMVAQVSGFTGVYADPVGSGQTFYYWVRAINVNGIAGPFNSGTGTLGQTAVDVSFLLTLLSNSITTSELATSLSTPIAKIAPLEAFTGFSSGYSGNSLLTRIGDVETVAGNAVSSAQLSSEQTTRANADSALASDITSLTSTVSGNTAAISSEATTRSNADSALSSSITTLQTTVGTNTASISTQATSINGLSAQYSVKIDNNGHVSGFGLSSTTTTAGPTSAFIVRADKFAIIDPASTADGLGTTTPSAASVPFVVQASSTTLNGVSVPAGVYMQDGFIKNGSIVNAKIGDAAIDNAKIASLDAGKINAGKINTSRLNIDGSTITSSIVNGTPVLKLGAASVDTLFIAGQAVTIMETKETTSVINITGNSGKVTVLSDSITLASVDSNSAVRISGSLSISNESTSPITVFIEIFDGTAANSTRLSAAYATIPGSTYTAPIYIHGRSLVPVSALDENPSNGSTTYVLKVQEAYNFTANTPFIKVQSGIMTLQGALR